MTDKNEQGLRDDLIRRYPALEPVESSIYDAYVVMRDAVKDGGKLIIAGNGGSAADADHIVGELMKGFVKRRPLSDEYKARLAAVDEKRGALLGESLQGAIPAISLTHHISLSTAFLNDVSGDLVYAQQLNGYGNAGDVFIGISTSGEADNINYAAVTAMAKGMKVVALTGKGGGVLGKLADAAVVVPDNETYRIQEYHLPIYHTWCLMLEQFFFSELDKGKR
jgi:D-sedoheptulose 7-phosphate isomerase